ncbi:PIG-L deacetylase family protein [Kineosporia sp. A_224]|uniref:PIG-L deacetylase family protein n=1 Tax=Kineosporia sp. A_224 TaxID=1962180 RepID=UPI000B4B4C90|nr:PIG-L deacetylase family protein [Kineosporia sp. A_224]
MTSTVLVLHAHPDDEAIFTGAAVRLLADRGLRVVLVTATDGGRGVPRVPLRSGETIRDRRLRELEEAADLLGAARLVVLPYADSGCHGGPYRPGSLGAAGVGGIARRVRQLAETEGAQAVVHYDERGVYGHVDHVQVHRAGARVAADLGLTGYEATVDPLVLRDGPRHVLAQVAGELLDVGLPADDITFAVRADDAVLGTKMQAMAAHASQIGPEYLDGTAEGYRHEWFVRRGAAGPVDAALAGHVVPAPTVVAAGAGRPRALAAVAS